jgi:hypothetical protein
MPFKVYNINDLPQSAGMKEFDVDIYSHMLEPFLSWIS